MDVFLTIVTSVVTFLLLIYYAATRNFSYWKKKKVPHPKPWPLFGNYAEYILHRKFTSEVSQEICRQFPNEPYIGTYFGTKPALLVQDPELIKLILTKDFYYFNSREIMDYTHKEVVTQNLFFSHGDKWKVVRQGLTPLFSSAKMRNMFYLIKNCAHSFEDMLDYETGMSKVLEVKRIMTRYTMDCICSCGFGIDVKTMDKNTKDNPFLAMGPLIYGNSISRGYRIMGRAIWPKIFYGLGFRCFPIEIDIFFDQILKGVFQGRAYEPTQRNDFVDLVLGLKQNKYITGDSIKNLKTKESKTIQLEVTDDLLVAQCVLFFGAGFETSAGALSLTVFELAKNQETQKRVQQEIDEFLKRHNNEIVYDCVSELPFLDACISETLRLYPVLPVLTREVVEDYTFPTGLRLEKGMRVHLPTYHIQRHPDHFPEPDLYKPERFLPEARHSIKPYTYFPFGEGPRTCLGMRFSKMQVIAGLITFLKKFHVTLAEDTPERIKHSTTTFVLQPASDLKLNVSLREGWESRMYKR